MLSTAFRVNGQATTQSVSTILSLYFEVRKDLNNVINLVLHDEYAPTDDMMSKVDPANHFLSAVLERIIELSGAGGYLVAAGKKLGTPNLDAKDWLPHLQVNQPDKFPSVSSST
jgi:hypothetical protein